LDKRKGREETLMMYVGWYMQHNNGEECDSTKHLVLTLSFITIHITFHAIITVISTEFRIFTFESFEILTSFRELTFLHTLTHVPVDESTLGEHEIELLVHAAEHLTDSSGVSLHADCTRKIRHVTAGDNNRGTAVKTSLETGRTPVDKLDGALVLDLVDGNADILGNDVTTVHQAAGHVLTLARIALHEGVGGLESSSGDLLDGVHLMGGTGFAHKRSVGGGKEVDARMRNQVNLELVDIHVERTLKAKRGSERRNNLGDKTVEVGVRGTRDAEVVAANVIESLVVHEECTIGVLQHCMSSKDGVVWLNNSAAELWRRPDDEVQLALLAVIRAQTFEQKAGETRTGTTTNAVEDEEALKTSAIVSKLTDAIHGNIDHFLANGVMTTSKVVCCVLTTTDELVGVMETAVWASANLVDNTGLKINENRTRNKLSTAGFAEESAQRIVLVFFCNFFIDSSIRTNSVLKAEKFPGGVAGLNTSLANMNHNAFSHFVM